MKRKHGTLIPYDEARRVYRSCLSTTSRKVDDKDIMPAELCGVTVKAQPLRRHEKGTAI